jgi:hypothetical protein
MVRMTRRSALVAVVLTLAVIGTVWPTPTLDPADLDTVLPTERDLPGFVPFDGLTGSLSMPAENVEGRAVLTGAKLDEQCRIWQRENDGWACQDLDGAGMVVLELSENVFFRVLSNVLAYSDEGAAVAAWDGLVADIRREVPDAGQRSAEDLGDENLVFTIPSATVLAIRHGAVVVECIVWDGSDQVSAQEERDMAERWPALQLNKIDELAG